MYRGDRTVRVAQARKRRRSFLLRVGSVLAFLVMLAAGLSALAGLDALTISSVRVESVASVPSEDIERIAAGAMEGRYLFLFPKANALLYPASSLKAAIAEAFPRLESVELSLSNPTTLSVSLAERVPHALWCGGERTVEVSQCYFLDKTGFVFSKAPEFSGNVFLRYYGGIAADDPIGAFFFSPERFKQIDFFIKSVKDAGVDPASFAVLPQEDVEVALSNGTRILFNLAQDLSAVFENFESVLVSDVFKDQGVLKLDYLDLRFGNKVFYKFR